MIEPTNLTEFPIQNADLTNETILETSQRKFSLPEDLNVENIIRKNIPAEFIPSALTILATIKSITDYKNQFDRRYYGDAMAFLSNNDIRNYLSNLHGKTPRLLRAMEQAGWLEIDNSYRVQWCSKGYRIGSRFAESVWKEMLWADALNLYLPEIHEGSLTVGRKARLLKLWDRACGFFYSWKGVKDDVLREVCRVTAGILTGLSIHDSVGLVAQIQRCASQLQPGGGPVDVSVRAWSNSIKAVEAKQLFVACHDERRLNFTNRIFTNWTGMKREFRPFFQLFGRQMFSVDIKACQPALLASLYDENVLEDAKEKKKYVQIMKQGDLYEILADQLNQAFPKKKFDRARAKSATIVMMFSRTIAQNRDFYNVFKGMFPVLTSRMEESKRRSYKNLSRLMQLKESKIMNHGVLKELLLEQNICCLSVHDSIWTFEENIEAARAAIVRCFSREMGFQPQLKIERNGADENRVNSSESLKLAA